MRAFVAIEVSEGVRETLGALSHRLRPCRVRASWVKPEDMHLTLRFLGEVDEDQVVRIGDLLSTSYAAVEGFELSVDGTGAFPNLRRPSVLWAGVGPLDGALSSTQAMAEDAAQAIGLKREKRRFHPHLTLARVREPDRASELAALLARERVFHGGTFTVAGVSLFSSTLAPAGAKYQRLREFPF